MKIIRDYFKFIIYGINNENTYYPLSSKIVSILILLIFHFFLLILIAIINSAVMKYGMINPLKKSDGWGQVKNLNLLVLPVVLAPILEETTFRLWIKREKYLPLSFTFGNLVFNLFINGFLSLGNLLQNVNFLLTSAFIFFALSFLVTRNRFKIHKIVQDARLWVIVSALLFGYIHITHFSVNWGTILFSPILLAPFIIMGILYGYVRVKFGFIYAIGLHMAYNICMMMHIFLL